MSQAYVVRWRRWLLATVIYVALSLLFTYPLTLHLGDSVLGWPGDNLEYVWKMWWFKHAIVDEHTSPFWAPQVYYPYGLEMAHAEMTPAHTVLGIPLTMAFGPVVSYNVVVLASFVLTGLATHLLASEYTVAPVAALASGIAFAFCPYRVAHSAGHLPLMGTQWIPLTLWCLERWRKHPSWGWSSLAGLSFSLAALSSWYYAVMLALVLPVFMALRCRPWRGELWRKEAARGALCFAAVAGLMIGPFAVPYLRLWHQGGMQHDFGSIVAGSAEMADLVVPNLLHPAWGGRLQGYFPAQAALWVERSLYLGVVALLLALLGTWWRRREHAVQAYGGIVLLACVLALGPLLRWGGHNVVVSLPQWLERLLVQGGLWQSLLHRLDASDGRLVVPLPAQVLWRFVPGFGSIRVWARWGVFAACAMALLAGLGLDSLLRRISARPLRSARDAVGWGVIALVVLDFLAIPALWPISQPYLSETKPRAVDLWLSTQERGALIQFPIALEGPQLYYSITHGRQMAMGYGTFVPRPFQEKRAVLDTFPSVESLAVLAEWQVRYVLVRSAGYGDRWPEVSARIGELEGLRLVQRMEGIDVYVLER